MPDAQVQVVISAKDQNASSTFKKVGSSAADLGKTLAVGIAAGAAGIAAGLGVAVAKAADFEKQMSGVRAVSGATAEQMGQLSGLALQLGKDTSFSASEAAQGLEELVKGGVTIPDIMNGAAQATLNLAAAGGTDLASAAEIASNALNTFNLSGQDMAHVSDLIAGAANASAIDVSDFRLSLAAAGSVTATVGGSFDDLAVAIAEMGNAGIKGSDAGTSLKTMLLNLQPQTDKQRALMQQLGLITADGANKFFDAQGSLRSFADVSQVLQDALKGQTDQQKLATLETLFGSDAIRAAAVLAENGAEGFDTLAASMSKVTAESVAAQRLDNLAGDIEQLKGSAETAAIVLGQAFQGALRSAVQGMTDFINNGVIPFVQQHGPAMAQALQDASTAIGTFAGNLKTGAIDALESIKSTLQATGPAWAQWAASAGPAGRVVGDALSAATSAADALQALLQGDFKRAAESARSSFDQMGSAAREAAAAVDQLRDAVAQLSATRTFLSDLDNAAESLRESFNNLSATTRGLLSNVLPLIGAAGDAGNKFDLWGAIVRAVDAPIINVTESIQRLSVGMRASGDAANFVSAAFQAIAPLFSSVEAAAQTLAQAADIVRAAFVALAGTVGGAIAEMAGNVSATLSGLAATAGAQAVAIGTAIVNGIRNGITSGVQALAASAAAAASSALAAAKAALGISSPSREFMEVGAQIVAGLSIGIDDAAPAAEAAAIDLGQSVIDAVKAGLGKARTLEAAFDPLRGTVAGAMQELAAAVDDLNDSTERKFAEIGEKAGAAFNQAIVDADRSIQSTIRDTDARISDMIDNMSLGRQIRALRDTFSAGQDADALARSRSRDAEDLQRQRARDDKNRQLDLQKDLEKAKTAEERAGILDRFAEASDDLRRRRQEEDEDREYRRKREDEDRDYRKQQEQARQQFEDKIDDDGLRRSISRAQQDRDERIKSINDALTEKQKKIDEDAKEEQRKLIATTQDKIQALKDEFVSKLPKLTAGAQDVVNTFLAGIDQALQRTASLARATAAAIASVGSASGDMADAAQAAADAALSMPNPPVTEDTIRAHEAAASSGSGLGAGGGFGGGKINFLAAGGIVRKPTLAVVGERGPEAVVPLNGMRSGPIVLQVDGTTFGVLAGGLSSRRVSLETL